MSKHILRWHYKLKSGKARVHYTYGHINTLREKAKVLAENDQIVYVTIDEVKEVVKDTREEKFLELINNSKEGEDVCQD